MFTVLLSLFSRLNIVMVLFSLSPSPARPHRLLPRLCLKVMQLLKESGTAEEHSLDKEARKWASRVAREYKSIIHTQRVRARSDEEMMLWTGFRRAL